MSSARLHSTKLHKPSPTLTSLFLTHIRVASYGTVRVSFGPKERLCTKLRTKCLMPQEHCCEKLALSLSLSLACSGSLEAEGSSHLGSWRNDPDGLTAAGGAITRSRGGKEVHAKLCFCGPIFSSLPYVCLPDFAQPGSASGHAQFCELGPEKAAASELPLSSCFEQGCGSKLYIFGGNKINAVVTSSASGCRDTRGNNMQPAPGLVWS